MLQLFDHDCNLKIGPEKNFVWAASGAYIQYFNTHRNAIVYGIDSTLQKMGAECRIFRNLNHPGSIVSFSHLFALGHEQDRWQWTDAPFSFGKQAYKAATLAEPEAVNHNSVLTALSHYKWLDKDCGVFQEISFVALDFSHQKTSMSLGVFREF